MGGEFSTRSTSHGTEKRFIAMLKQRRAELEHPIDVSLDAWKAVRRFEEQSGEDVADSKASVVCHGAG